MKKFIVFISTILFCTVSIAQVSNDNTYFDISTDLYQMMQKQNTSSNVIEFFSKSNLNFNTDTIIAIFLPPMTCARCEGEINPFIFKIRKKKASAKIIIVAIYPKADALEDYFEKRKFAADNIIASIDNGILSNFYFNTGELAVPFFTKIDIKTGDLLLSKSSLGLDLNDEFISQFLAYKGRMPKVDSSKYVFDDFNNTTILNLSLSNLSDLKNKILKPSKEIHIVENKDYPISDIQYPELNIKENYFSFMNQLNYNIMLYRIEDSMCYFESSFYPTNKIERQFISDEISDSVYYLLKKLNIINSMLFKSWVKYDTIVIDASLPKIFWKDREEEEIAYYNKIAFLYYNKRNRDLLKIVTLTDLPDSTYTLEHLRTFFEKDVNLFFVPLLKGWPAIGTDQFKMIDTLENPFIDQFYDGSFSFAVFDKEGVFIKYFYPIDSVFRANKLGYYFSNPIVKIVNQNVIVAEMMTGSMSFYKSIYDSIPFKKINTIDIPGFMSKNDYLEKPLDYLNDYKQMLNTSLMDFCVAQNHLIVALKESSFYLLKIFDKNGQFLDQKLIPNSLHGMNLKFVKLYNKSVSPILYAFYEDNLNRSIFVFNLKE